MFCKRHFLYFYISYCLKLSRLVYRLILGHSGTQNSHYLKFKGLERSKFDLVICLFQNYVHPAFRIFFTSVKVLGSSYEFGPLDVLELLDGLQDISYMAFLWGDYTKIIGLNIFILNI